MNHGGRRDGCRDPPRARDFEQSSGSTSNSCRMPGVPVCPLVCPFTPTSAASRFRHRTASATGARTFSDMERHPCRQMSESVVDCDGPDKREVRGSTPRWPIRMETQTPQRLGAGVGFCVWGGGPHRCDSRRATLPRNIEVPLTNPRWAYTRALPGGRLGHSFSA